jgi:hypothetical protein
MLHHDSAPAHMLLLIHEFFGDARDDCLPPNALLSRFCLCRLFFVLKIEIRSERSLISDDRRDRRKFAMAPMHYPAKRVPELEKMKVVCRQRRGVL